MQIPPTLRRRARLTIAAALLILVFAAACNLWVEASAQSDIFTDPNAISFERVGIVLGTDQYWRGGVSPYYQNRIDAAARLYHAGKVKYLIVSGNPWHPAAMRASLMQQGVPSDRIILDPEGRRTLNSILRARDIFDTRSFVVISQADHCARAIYLARAYGCHAVGFAAADPGHPKNILREFFARPKAVLDVWLLHPHAGLRGPKTPIIDKPEPNQTATTKQ